MTTLWVAAWAGGARYFTTEDAAERVAKAKRRELEIDAAYRRRLGQIPMFSTEAVCYPIVVEPPIRLGYWARRRDAA